MPRLLSAAGLDRVVVGHTIQQDARIHVRFGGTVFLIDTGMNTAYAKRGRGSALEIVDGTVTAIYPGEPRQVIWPAPAKAAESAPARTRVFLGPDGQPLPFANDDELLEFLREARVVEVQAIGEGITHPRRLTLERNGVRAHAIFRNVHAQDPLDAFRGRKRDPGFRDYYGFEPAAYRLGLLLGIDNIPPATLRRLEGEPGSVQIWIERAMTEHERREAKTEPPEPLQWQRQLQVRMVWDTLIGNSDRNQGNTLYAPDWKMWLIDHTRSFRARRRPSGRRATSSGANAASGTGSAPSGTKRSRSASRRISSPPRSRGFSSGAGSSSPSSISGSGSAARAPCSSTGRRSGRDGGRDDRILSGGSSTSGEATAGAAPCCSPTSS